MSRNPSVMARCTRSAGFTLLELAVVICALLGIVMLFLLTQSGHRHHHRHNTQLRGIHQSLVVYAQGNGSGGGLGYFPGLDASGVPADLTVENRFHLMLKANFFSPDYLISPQETANKTAWTGGPFTADNYSFAMLQVPAQGGRYDEWSETLNMEAIVLSDRNTGRDATRHVSSLSTTTNSGDWEGGVIYNDNHVSFETTTRLDTMYGSISNKRDNIFEPAGDSDAYLIDRGN